MFRSSEKQSPLDDIVSKATSETLTSENWELILDVCDKVNDDPEDGAKNAVAAITKRLQVYKANVQLYSLTLVNSLAQNCGSKMHRELATKSFTNLLLKLADDKNVHHTVKTKIAESMQTLVQEFASDPSLRLMNDAFVKLMKKHPNIHPPAKPDKTRLTEADKKKEEEELQVALALSLSEQQPFQTSKDFSYGPGDHLPPSSVAYPEPQAYQEAQNQHAIQQELQQQQQQQTKQPQPQEQPMSASTVTKVRALYDLNASEEGELSFRKGDVIRVIESVYKDWWRGSLRGQTGIFPLNYVEPVPEPTQEELLKEAQDEMRVFEQSRNIEKLLAALNSVDAQNSLALAENEELQNLYHSTLSVRPKLVKLIDKYSQKKDEFIDLNDKFMKARKKYDTLMEASVSQFTRRTSSISSSTPADLNPFHSGSSAQYSSRPPAQTGPPQSPHSTHSTYSGHSGHVSHGSQGTLPYPTNDEPSRQGYFNQQAQYAPSAPLGGSAPSVPSALQPSYPQYNQTQSQAQAAPRQQAGYPSQTYTQNGAPSTNESAPQQHMTHSGYDSNGPSAPSYEAERASQQEYQHNYQQQEYPQGYKQPQTTPSEYTQANRTINAYQPSAPPVASDY